MCLPQNADSIYHGQVYTCNYWQVHWHPMDPMWTWTEAVHLKTKLSRHHQSWKHSIKCTDQKASRSERGPWKSLYQLLIECMSLFRRHPPCSYLAACQSLACHTWLCWLRTHYLPGEVTTPSLDSSSSWLVVTIRVNESVIHQRTWIHVYFLP